MTSVIIQVFHFTNPAMQASLDDCIMIEQTKRGVGCRFMKLIKIALVQWCYADLTQKHATVWKKKTGVFI